MFRSLPTDIEVLEDFMEECKINVMQIPSRFLFRFRFPCYQAKSLWSPKGIDLDDTFRLPNVAELDNPAKPEPYTLKAAWNSDGIALSLTVFGKKQQPWCRPVHPEESDGFHLVLDTRDVHDVHRATRFCHRLVFLPFGNGPSQSDPIALWLPIHRAKGHPNPIETKQIRLLSRHTDDGYRFDMMIPGSVLTGFDPAEHPNLGFHFALVDRELGNRSFLVGPPFPFDQDPSLWGTLELKTQ